MINIGLVGPTDGVGGWFFSDATRTTRGAFVALVSTRVSALGTVARSATGTMSGVGDVFLNVVAPVIGLTLANVMFFSGVPAMAMVAHVLEAVHSPLTPLRPRPLPAAKRTFSQMLRA